MIKSAFICIKQLWLIVLLLLLASGWILTKDYQRNKARFQQQNTPSASTQARSQLPVVALFKFSSRPVLDESEEGVIVGLARSGWHANQNYQLVRYDAQNEMNFAQQIAQEIVNTNPDLIITLSTPCLQVMLQANRTAQIRHVFGTVTDPFTTGAGPDPARPEDHLPYVTGVGTFQPIEKSLALALQMYPNLSTIGTVWNPSEVCSAVCTQLLRQECARNGITLREATVEKSTDVLQAAEALVSQGVQALQVGGDNTVELAIDSVNRAAAAARIPVWGHTPEHVKNGNLFALGADYSEVGVSVGQMAARVLAGENPADIPIQAYVPEKLYVNLDQLALIKDSWNFPPEIMQRVRAAVHNGLLVKVHDGQVTDQPVAAGEPLSSPTPFPEDKVWRVGLVDYGEDPTIEQGQKGLIQALRDEGFVPGENLELDYRSAQGDVGMISTILQKFMSDQKDLIITMTTPVTAAAAALVRDIPLVCACVYYPLEAGLGTSPTDHLPNATGVGSAPPIEETFAMITKTFPEARRIGTLYNPGEPNAARAINTMRQLMKQSGIEFVERSVDRPSDVSQVANSLVGAGVDLIYVTGDNTVISALPAVVTAARHARLPLILNDPDILEHGGIFAVGFDFYVSGYEGGKVAAKVLRGTSPADIPIRNIAQRHIAVNLGEAARMQLELPKELIAQADLFVGFEHWSPTRKHLGIIQLTPSLPLESARNGVLAGLREAGIDPDRDIELTYLNAQGEIPHLKLLTEKLLSQSVDALVTITTPALMTAANATQQVPVIFTVASEPALIGICGADGNHCPLNVTGVYEVPPIRELIALIRKTIGPIERIGLVFDNSQPNTQISANRLRELQTELQYQLKEATITNPTEIDNAVTALAVQGAQVIVTSADNTVAAGLAGLVQSAQRVNLPVFATEPDYVEQGIAGAVGLDYHQWGQASGILAARVLAGAPIELIPMRPAQQLVRRLNPSFQKPVSASVARQALEP